jgi:hypothetical protein
MPLPRARFFVYATVRQDRADECLAWALEHCVQRSSTITMSDEIGYDMPYYIETVITLDDPPSGDSFERYLQTILPDQIKKREEDWRVLIDRARFEPTAVNVTPQDYPSPGPGWTVAYYSALETVARLPDCFAMPEIYESEFALSDRTSTTRKVDDWCAKHGISGRCGRCPGYYYGACAVCSGFYDWKDTAQGIASDAVHCWLQKAWVRYFGMPRKYRHSFKRHQRPGK